MLKDDVRTKAYQRAIEDNKLDFKGKVVLDIGAGTGILSIFAARAGAKKVFAVENAEIAYFAEGIVKKNGFSKVITVLKGKMEEVKLPVKKVDIIISEWMGYFLLYESMLDSVLWARDKYLVEGGLMLPDKAQIFVAAIEDQKLRASKKSFWANVYGVDMSCLSETVFKDPMIDVLPPTQIISSECKILDLNLGSCKANAVQFSTVYQLTFAQNNTCYGLVSWFDTVFHNLENPVTLSTSPYKKYTHWKQVTFFVDEPFQVRKGDVLKGSIAVRQSKSNFRELDVKISYHYESASHPELKKDFVQMYKVK